MVGIYEREKEGSIDFSLDNMPVKMEKLTFERSPFVGAKEKTVF